MKPALPLSFPPFRLDLVNECLWREGQRVPLRAKTFKVMCCLLEHSGQLVTKEALFKAVWPNTAVGDAVLMTCISELRQALGDDAKTPRFIETVHRRGYRFIGAVRRPGSGVRSHKSEPIPSPQSLVPHFVGREAEIAQLYKWLDKALNGEHQIVFISGEPGIGKTTVVEAFLAQVAAKGGIWIGRGQCIEHYGAGEGHMPVLEALGRLCRAPGGERLIELLGQHAPTWLVQMPALLSAAKRKRLQREVQGATRERMLREMAEAVEAVTAERPLVLRLEDLHWSDASTLELLSSLARRQEHARLLVISTYRPVEVLENGHPLRAITQELQLHRHCEEMPLTLLNEAAVAEYLSVRFRVETQHAASLQSLARLIHHRTEGNPLFMVNVVEDIVAQGGLGEIDGQRNLSAAAVEAVVHGVPTSIRQMIERQIDWLSPEEQRVLEVASVAGADFSAAAVAAGAETEVASVEARCAGLARREQFLRANGISEWPDGTVAARYGFLHALYQEVLYERVPAGQRIDLYRRIGKREEQAYGDRVGEIAAELAVHFERGREYRRAVHYHHQAAETAIQRHAYQEAVSHLTDALELLKTLPDTPERDRQELGLQFTLYIQLGKLKGEATTEAEGAVARVCELSQRVEQTREVFWALAGIYPFYLVREELQTARSLAEQCLQLAQRLSAPPFLLTAHTELGIVCFFLGQFPVACTHLEQAIAHYTAQPPLPLSFDWDHGPPCFCYTAFILWHLGYPDQALQQSQKALAKMQALRLPYMHVFVLNFTARLHQLRRERDAVQKYADTALRLATEHGFAGMAEVGRILSGWALAESSKGEEGVAQIRQSLTAFQANGGAAFRAYYLALLTEACSKAGQVEEGLTVVTEALAVVECTEGRYYEAELHRLKGVLTLQSRVQSPRSKVEAEAEACFHKAIDIARRQSAKSLELRAVMSLSRLWQQQGKKQQARQMLAEIYNWFTEGFDTADLQEAEALLEALSH